MRGKTAVLALVGLLTAVSALQAQQSLLTLTQTADAIVIGSAEGFGMATNNTFYFKLNVVRVLKGPVPPGTNIMVGWVNYAVPGGVYWPPNYDPTRVVLPQATGDGIWFMQRYYKDWLLLSVKQRGPFQSSFFPASLSAVPAPYAYPTTASVDDKVASELAAAIENESGHNQLFDSVLNGDLDKLSLPVARVLYQRLAASDAPEKQMLGLAGLIRHGDIDALNSAVRSAPAWAEDPSTENAKLIGTIRYQVRPYDPAAIAVLGRAATDSRDPNLNFRAAAAHALAAVHSKETLPYLATLMDDPNAELRAEGINGMGAFALGLPVRTGVLDESSAQTPNTDSPYRNADTIAHFAASERAIEKDEAAYISFWKNWWSQNKAALGY